MLTPSLFFADTPGVAFIEPHLILMHAFWTELTVSSVINNGSHATLCFQTMRTHPCCFQGWRVSYVSVSRGNAGLHALVYAFGWAKVTRSPMLKYLVDDEFGLPSCNSISRRLTVAYSNLLPSTSTTQRDMKSW